MNTKLCIFFPFAMGESFLSGGVSKLVIANIHIAYNHYQIYLIMPEDNDSFEKFIKNRYPNVIVKQVRFFSIARFKDTKSILVRFFKTIKRIVLFVYTKRNVRKVIQHIQPDIVHFHAEVSLPYMKYAKSNHFKAILHASVFRFSKPEILRYFISKLTLRYANLVISPTYSIASLFDCKTETFVIRNPILQFEKSINEEDVEYQVLVNKNDLNAVFVGRICRVKQIHYFVNALSLLPDDIKTKIKFYIIGQPNNSSDEKYFSEINAYIHRNKLVENVFFLGYKNNIESYLKIMDVAVLLSESEAIPMAGIEYINNGLPIIAFNNPGLNEIVEEDTTGFLTENGNIEEIANILVRLYMNPEILKRVSASSNKFAQQHYSIESFQSKILEKYRLVLS